MVDFRYPNIVLMMSFQTCFLSRNMAWILSVLDFFFMTSNFKMILAVCWFPCLNSLIFHSILSLMFPSVNRVFMSFLNWFQSIVLSLFLILLVHFMVKNSPKVPPILDKVAVTLRSGLSTLLWMRKSIIFLHHPSNSFLSPSKFLGSLTKYLMLPPPLMFSSLLDFPVVVTIVVGISG